MRAHERLAGQLVERTSEPLGEPAAVDEQQRRLVPANQLEQPRVNRGPDRLPCRALRCRTARQIHRLGHACHILDRHFDAQLQQLLFRRVHDRDRAERGRLPIVRELVVQLRPDVLDAGRVLSPGARRGRPPPSRNGSCLDAAKEMRHLVERPLRRGETDPLERLVVAQGFEPLQRQRQVRPALAGHQGVNLVDDDCVHRLQPLAGP
jgi:hypothetical protein